MFIKTSGHPATHAHATSCCTCNTNAPLRRVSHLSHPDSNRRYRNFTDSVLYFA